MAIFALTGQDGRRSDIEVANGLAASLGDRFAAFRSAGIFLIHDPAIAALAQSLAPVLGLRALIPTSGAESAKTLREIERLSSLLLEAGADRSSLLVGLGGGAVLDLCAFLAGIYFRGMSCALLPTSMLAAVDAAVGGKSAVDLGATKNVLGLIRQPDFVVCDPTWMETLPDHEFRQGLAELIKMAAILDEEVFHHLEGVIDDLLARDPATVESAVVAGIRMKAAVVQEDEREQGLRMLLNFGHTLGHALEACSRFRLAHGDAVAIGMVGELEMLGIEAPRIEALLASAGLPIAVPAALRDHETLWRAMTRDKKNRGGEVRVAVPTRIGQGEVRVVTRRDLEKLR